MNAIKDPMFVNRAVVPVKSVQELRDYTLKLYEERPEVKDKISDSVKKLWEDPEYILMQKEARKDHPEKMKEKWKDPDFKASQSEKISKALQSSEVRKTEEYKAKERENGKRFGESTKRFLDNLKKDPVAYKAYMDARTKKVRETYARKKAQRPEQ